MEKQKLSDQVRNKWTQLGIPASGILELTPRCNLDCKMCYVHLTGDQMRDRKELTVDQWIKILDEAFDMGLFKVTLTGGECLTYPGFWDLYTYLREKGIAVVIKTNALLLNQENVDRLAALPPSGIYITLYGPSEETYFRTTGRRAFQQVKENLERLLAAGLIPHVSITVSRYNAEEAVETLDLLRSYGLSPKMEVNLNEPEPETGRKLESFALTNEEIVAKLVEVRRHYGYHMWENPPQEQIPPRLPDNPDDRGVACGAGKSAFLIHWDGTMAACFDMDTQVNVLNVGFAAAWEEAKRVSREFQNPVECRDCPLRFGCHNCVCVRRDPKNPGHADPAMCERTVMKYNAGLFVRQDKLDRPETEKQDEEDC